MGVAGLWDILRPVAKTRSLTQLSVVDGFEANPDGVRGFRIGIDASIWFFHAEYGKEGENPVLRTLFFRCATLMRSPFLPLFVFDGPKRPDVKRGKKINKTSHKLIPGMKQIVEAFGFEWRTAPGEAEAELAYLNRIGVIDGILSDDVDNFLFGATTVIRNPSNTLSGNRANPNLNSSGKDDKNHTRVYHLSDITEHPDVRLTRGGLILIGLMSGGDYEQGGLARCGVVTAHGLAKCGFGDTLYTAATNLSRDHLPAFLSNWRCELRQELRTNFQGHIGRKLPSLANAIPEDFPNIDILLSYVNPITSESMGREQNNLLLKWSKEPDLAKLAAVCEFYFEWGYKEAIIKRFRTVIWHSAVLRILRRAVLDADAAKEYTPETSTPRKPKKGDLDSPVGTPSKMIAKHFSSLSLGQLKGLLSDDSDIEEDPDEKLIVKVHSSRTHASTDGILEYRLEVAPIQLVRIAESGIKGTRVPDGPDEWASEGEDGENTKTGTKKPPPDPESHLRLWMPASMVKIAEPHLVEEFEESEQRKKAKKTGVGKGRGKAPARQKEKTSTKELAGDQSGGEQLPSPSKVVPRKASASIYSGTALLPNPPISRRRRTAASSSDSESYSERLKKSPRKAKVHSSPSKHGNRAAAGPISPQKPLKQTHSILPVSKLFSGSSSTRSKMSTLAIDISTDSDSSDSDTLPTFETKRETIENARPGSPSPLRKPTRPTNISSSSAIFYQQSSIRLKLPTTVIELSSDSDTPVTSSSIPPLLAARARAAVRKKPPQKTLQDFSPTPRKMHASKAASNIIDLT